MCRSVQIKDGNSIVLSWLARRFALVVAFTLATIAIQLAIAPAAKARTDDRNKPVVLVHGLENDPRDGFGWDCDYYWGRMIDYLRIRGWSNTINPVTYYENDTVCNPRNTVNGQASVLTSNISLYGSNNWYFNSDGERGTGHTANASIRHLAQHFAWFLYETYGKNGQTVDVVAHSMGGLIVRYAINAVEKGFRDFPPRILIEDAVTLGTPHGGANQLTNLCGVVQSYVQCKEMSGESPSVSPFPGITVQTLDSELIRYLKTEALNPQGEGGTQWSLLGSNQDVVVSEESAVFMNAEYRVIYIDENILHFHFDSGDVGKSFLTNNRFPTDANAEVWNGSQFVNRPSYYWPLRYIDLALTYRAW
jgi:hypothetical protein